MGAFENKKQGKETNKKNNVNSGRITGLCEAVLASQAGAVTVTTRMQEGSQDQDLNMVRRPRHFKVFSTGDESILSAAMEMGIVASPVEGLTFTSPSRLLEHLLVCGADGITVIPQFGLYRGSAMKVRFHERGRASRQRLGDVQRGCGRSGH